MAEESFDDGVFDDLWVRSPDSERLDDVDVGARLCSCRSVCLAVIDDGGGTEP
ncbi:hypothetical protein [Longimicrobium sp.]|uniref:hypothetical protein n=1 Tax=Longimicrobium sp. TaxID=2029185 RepID=UPI002E3440C7|nr:hypothetical protein [Longimicrobium sp.]HEX6042490.1 hypothetical protein [Longimicrobium sp.]